MHLARSLTPRLLLVLGVAACGDVQSSSLDESSDETQSSESSDNSSDAEEERANRPEMVTGAFLGAIGPAALDVVDPEAPPSEEGYEIFGAGLYDVKTEHKARTLAGSLLVVLELENGETIQPAMVEASRKSVWHVYFRLPKGQIADVVTATIIGSTDGVEVVKSKVKLDYRPIPEAALPGVGSIGQSVGTDHDDDDDDSSTSRSGNGNGNSGNGNGNDWSDGKKYDKDGWKDAKKDGKSDD